MRWPEDGTFYEAVITDYNPSEETHCVVYNYMTPEEEFEWVHLRQMPKSDVIWVEGPPVVLPLPGGLPSGAPVGPGRGAAGLRRSTSRSGSGKFAGRGRSGLRQAGGRDSALLSGPGRGAGAGTSVELPKLERLVKEVEVEEDLLKIEDAKRAAKEKEEALRRQMEALGSDSSDDEDNDDGDAIEQDDPSAQRLANASSGRHGQEEDGDEGEDGDQHDAHAPSKASNPLDADREASTESEGGQEHQEDADTW
eukprot:SM000075S21927  [mRNA]  locus=s75:25440:27224:- [translate_table: standard]